MNKPGGQTLPYSSLAWNGIRVDKLIEWRIQEQTDLSTDNWFSTKVQKQFSGKRIIISTNGAITIKYQYVKNNELWSVTHSIEKKKKKLKMNHSPKCKT